ncbi:MAG: Sec-independent protein translocase protein TatB [Actinomycetales bacterium]|nr:Sec-independent protein translocase protein TatB [Actinomycetales bacterium]
MFDIGIGEIMVLAVVGLLVFGPERLPKAAADAARMLRNVRAMAANARKDLADSAGLDLGEAADTVRGLADLHPRRLATGLFAADDSSDDRASDGTSAAPSAPTVARPAFDPDAT